MIRNEKGFGFTKEINHLLSCKRKRLKNKWSHGFGKESSLTLKPDCNMRLSKFFGSLLARIVSRIFPSIPLKINDSRICMLVTKPFFLFVSLPPDYTYCSACAMSFLRMGVEEALLSQIQAMKHQQVTSVEDAVRKA